jgi:hypothetical protein
LLSDNLGKLLIDHFDASFLPSSVDQHIDWVASVWVRRPCPYSFVQLAEAHRDARKTSTLGSAARSWLFLRSRRHNNGLI